VTNAPVDFIAKNFQRLEPEHVTLPFPINFFLRLKGAKNKGLGKYGV